MAELEEDFTELEDFAEELEATEELLFAVLEEDFATELLLSTELEELFFTELEDCLVLEEDSFLALELEPSLSLETTLDEDSSSSPPALVPPSSPQAPKKRLMVSAVNHRYFFMCSPNLIPKFFQNLIFYRIRLRDPGDIITKFWGKILKKSKLQGKAPEFFQKDYALLDSADGFAGSLRPISILPYLAIRTQKIH